MKNNLMEYPHPVLMPDGKDYINASFSLSLLEQNDEGKNISLILKAEIDCVPLKEMISKGDLKVIIRVICMRTSYREPKSVQNLEYIDVEIPKERVMGTIFIQGMIVAAHNGVNYDLDSFNRYYFDDQKFVLKKGDIVAYTSEMIIKLNTSLQKNIPGVVLVSTAPDIKSLKVVYAKEDETNEKYQNYITIWLPEDEYISYEKLRKKKSIKSGVARFLQASLIVPALTEAISKLRMEDQYGLEPGESSYHGTIWADSICYSLKQNFGVDDLNDCQYSDYELANKLLGNVEGDSLDNLLRRIREWSMISQEDEI